MKILKYFKDGTWTSLYANILSMCLDKRQNLGDIEDKEQARINLELNGDNNISHYHDSRYIPIINQTKGEILGIIEQNKTELENTFQAAKETNYKRIVVQAYEPADPIENQILFCITENNPCIKVYTKGKWVTIANI